MDRLTRARDLPVSSRVDDKNQILLNIWREIPIIVPTVTTATSGATAFPTNPKQIHIRSCPICRLHSPVIEAPDEGEDRQVVQERQVAGDDDGDLETGLNRPAEQAQGTNRCQQQPRRPKLHDVVHRRLKPAAA